MLCINGLKYLENVLSFSVRGLSFPLPGPFPPNWSMHLLVDNYFEWCLTRDRFQLLSMDKLYDGRINCTLPSFVSSLLSVCQRSSINYRNQYLWMTRSVRTATLLVGYGTFVSLMFPSFSFPARFCHTFIKTCVKSLLCVHFAFWLNWGVFFFVFFLLPWGRGWRIGHFQSW